MTLSSQPLPSSRRHRRPLVGLLCASLLLAAACSATEEPAAVRAGWPASAPATIGASSPGVVRQTLPNFEAPSATSCARPIRTHEWPGIAQSAAVGVSSSGDAMAAPAASPRSASGAAAVKEAGEAEARPFASAAALADRAAMPAPPPVPSPAMVAAPAAQRQAGEPVTAGMVDDNADFAAYLQYRGRTQVEHRERDIAERYLLQVRDARGRPVPDAEIAVQAADGAAMWARTDAGGRTWLHPNAFDAGGSQVYEVSVRKDGRQSTGFLRRGQRNAVDLVLETPTAAKLPARARLDLVFLIDATGSMGDEIGKLKTTLRSIANEVAQLPSRPDTCFGLVAYRDRHDAFMVRSHDFTNDLGAFQRVLNALQADGGGDYPEAMNEALHETVHRLSWRGSGATRMVVLLADAPPHLDYAGPQYDDDMVAALGKGIKVFSVGASGLDPQGEYIQRQIAQYTGGRFVFLTYKDAANPASGPGSETVHDVDNYSVQTLDRLIVRLVSEELEKLPAVGS